MPYAADVEHSGDYSDEEFYDDYSDEEPQNHGYATVPAADADVKLPAEHSPAKGMESGDQAETEYLDRLVTETNPEVLEGGVEIGVQILEGLKTCLGPSLQTDGTQGPYWMKAIRELEARAKPTRTVVGVVGNVC